MHCSDMEVVVTEVETPVASEEEVVEEAVVASPALL